jgi:hypothetical protein
MRYARVIALAAAVAATQASAVNIDDCLAPQFAKGPRFVLDPISMGATADSIDVPGLSRNLEKSWDSAMAQTMRNLLSLDIQLVNCWRSRAETRDTSRTIAITDLGDTRVRNLFDDMVLGIGWGNALLPQKEVHVHFAIIPFLAATPPAGPRERIVYLKASGSDPGEILQSVVKFNVLSLIGVLTGLESTTSRLARRPPPSPFIGDTGTCWVDAIQSQLTWAGNQAAELTTEGENLWLAQWIDALRKRNAETARANPNASCLLK